MAARTNKNKWSLWAERGLWAVLASVLLYRCVLPQPAAEVTGALASARLTTEGQPLLVEFSSSR